MPLNRLRASPLNNSPVTRLADSRSLRAQSQRMSGRLVHAVVRALDKVAALRSNESQHGSVAPHQLTGKRGEEDAYFFLRRLGYVMVAKNFRVPRQRGEIDLVGWDRHVLCFIEVKTRTSHDVKPAEAAVDAPKQRELRIMANEYLRHLRHTPTWRFDIVTVYYEENTAFPKFELFKNAFGLS